MITRRLAGLFLIIFGAEEIIYNILFLLRDSLWLSNITTVVDYINELIYIVSDLFNYVDVLTIVSAGVMFLISKTKRRPDIIAGCFLIAYGVIMFIFQNIMGSVLLFHTSIMVFHLLMIGALACFVLAGVAFLAMRLNTRKTRVAGLLLIVYAGISCISYFAIFTIPSNPIYLLFVLTDVCYIAMNVLGLFAGILITIDRVPVIENTP